MSKRLNGLFDGDFVRAVGRMLSITGFMAVTTYITVSFLPLSVNDQSFFSAFPKFAIIVAVNFIIYIALSRAMRLQEVNPVLSRIKKIFFSKPKRL
jgi:hypothetical protein